MSDNGFIKKPNSLLSHQLWQEASGAERRILERLMELTVWEPSRMINGVLLLRRQVMFTYRQIVVDEKFSKKIVEGAINHFSGLTRNGKTERPVTALLRRQETGQDGRQKTRQQKSIHNMLITGFLDEEETRKETTMETTKNHSRRQEGDKTSSEPIYVLRHEDEQTLSNKLDKALVRHGGNVDNAQARYQHSPHAVDSPFSQKGEQKQDSSPPAADSSFYDSTNVLALFRILEDFRYSVGTWNGISLTAKDKKSWVTLTKDNPEDLLHALNFYKKQEANRIKQRGSYDNPPGFITTIITRRLWEKRKASDKGRKTDQEHDERLRANGSI